MGFIQGANLFDATNGFSTAASFGSAVGAAGRLLIVAFGRAFDDVANTPTDTLGTTFQLACSLFGTNISYKLDIWYGLSPSGGADTITITTGGGVNSRRLAIHEYDTYNTLDVVSTNQGASGPADSGAATTTHAAELIFGWGASGNGITVAGTGFTARQTVGSELTEDKEVITAGSYSAGFPDTGSGWVAAMATFYNPASGPPPTLDQVTPRVKAQAVRRSTFFCLGEKWAKRPKSGLIVPSPQRPLLVGA